jgi:hypothetical protein
MIQAESSMATSSCHSSPRVMHIVLPDWIHWQLKNILIVNFSRNSLSEASKFWKSELLSVKSSGNLKVILELLCFYVYIEYFYIEGVFKVSESIFCDGPIKEAHY